MLQGCTPGFWPGRNDFDTAGGKWLWNVENDQDWIASGGNGTNPYSWDTNFCGFFGGCAGAGTMMYYISPSNWTLNDDFHKAARSLTAAYLNASYGINYPYSQADLTGMWADAAANGTLLAKFLGASIYDRIIDTIFSFTGNLD